MYLYTYCKVKDGEILTKSIDINKLKGYKIIKKIFHSEFENNSKLYANLIKRYLRLVYLTYKQ